MPLIKSTSKRAFGENIARERAAGKPERQAVAIAYSERREAAKKPDSTAHHSKHSAKRSNDYHDKVVDSTYVRPSSTKMTRAEHQLNNDEDMSEKGHTL